MKIVHLHKLVTTKLGNVLLVLCLLALNASQVSGADALATQGNNTTTTITVEGPPLGFIKGTQLAGTNMTFPSDSNEVGKHMEYVKQTGKTKFIGVQSSKSTMKNISTAAPVINNRILIDFGPYIDGQDPNLGTVLSESQIRQRMQIIAPYSKWIRSFSCGNGLEVIGRLAHEMNLQVAVNAWIGPSDVVNQQQISCLINQANAGYVDLAIVGSEAILRGDVTPVALMNYIDQVRYAIPLSIPVTTADVYTAFLENPLLVDHIDLIFTNIYPFWEGYEFRYSIAMLNYYYNQLVATYPNKTIQISETGWPSCGSVGDAIGSLGNEARYFSQVDTWARDKNVTLFYFDGLDESWKVPYEGPQGGCWGIWDKNGIMKEGMASVFDGTSASAPYDLTLPSTCGTDQFSFNFTYVPLYGSFDNVQGQTCGIFHKDYQIMLYINVAGNWWVKPYAHDPTTSINSNGSWIVDYTTGGIDELATEIRAYLIPTNELDSCDPISNPCDEYPMISVTRPTDTHAFDKSSPANGATNQPLNPILSWGSSLNATRYEYCYDATNDDACSNWTSNGLATTKVLSGLNPVTTYYWHVRAVNGLGAYYYSNNSPDASWSFTTTISDISPPTISNITRLNINPTNTNNVNFTVAFSESVTGVDTTLPFSDFSLTTTGVTGATITGVGGSGATYTVTVNTGSGDGTIRLDVVDNNSIKDTANNPLGGVNVGDGNFSSGEVYTIIDTSYRLISGNVGVAGAILSYLDGTLKTVVADGNANYFLSVPAGWSGVVIPYKTGYIFTPLSKTYSNLQSNEVSQNYTAQACVGCADIHVLIGGNQVGGYTLGSSQGTRPTYALDAGPVEVTSTNSVPIIAALRDAWKVNGQVTSFAQLMGLPEEALSDTYYFPAYNNVTLSGQLRIGNVDTIATDVTVTIAGVVRGTYHLEPNQSVRPTYNLDAGPVVVQSSNGAKIIAALRDAWKVNGQVTSFAQLMGLPEEQLSDSYYFPAYNNVTLSGQLRIGNVDSLATDVTVTIAGVVRGTYHLEPNQSVRPTYNLDAGPVMVQSSNGAKIIAALRDAWLVNGQVTSFAQLMGLPEEQLSDTYLLPAYNNVTLSGQLRIGNVDSVATDVTVTIGGVVQNNGQPYHLEPSQSVRPTYNLDSGPVEVASSNGAKIIVALRDAWLVNGSVRSFTQLMGLPQEWLSTTYWFPAYNNVTLSGQLRFAVP